MRYRIKQFMLLFLFTSLLITLNACNGKEESDAQSAAAALKNKDISAEEAKNVMGTEVKGFLSGNFLGDSSKTGVAAREFSDSVGIKLTLLKRVDGQVVRVFDSKLLNGNLKNGKFEKVVFQGIPNEMIFYSSGDYFMGSGGGEIYLYVYDLAKIRLYYAHFFAVPRMPASLFLSHDIDLPQVRQYLLGRIKAEYPDVKLISKDKNLEDIF